MAINHHCRLLFMTVAAGSLISYNVARNLRLSRSQRLPPICMHSEFSQKGADGTMCTDVLRKSWEALKAPGSADSIPHQARFRAQVHLLTQARVTTKSLVRSRTYATSRMISEGGRPCREWRPCDDINTGRVLERCFLALLTHACQGDESQ